jgi:pimeloyl-ACP methyl ester carboxylesterase
MDTGHLPAADGLPLLFKGGGDVVLAGERFPGGERAVLLAHGFGQTRQSWHATQQRLAAAGHPSLSWDMRGHGQSGRNAPDHRYLAEQFVDDVLAAAAQLPPKPVLVGASMGGLTGLMAQVREPIFSALVLVDVTPRWEAAGMQRIHGFMTAFPDGFSSYDHAASAISDYLPHRRERKTPAQLATILRADDDGRLRWHWDPRLLGEFVEGSEHLQDVVADAARAVEVPVLLVSGGRSDLVSERTVSHFLECVPHARHVCLADATHMVAGDDNDAFTDTLLEFLGAQSFRSPSRQAGLPHAAHLLCTPAVVESAGAALALSHDPAVSGAPR